MKINIDQVKRMIRNNPGLLDEIELTARNRQIVKKRMEGKHFEDIGKDYNLSGERIRQICFSAFFKINKR